MEKVGAFITKVIDALEKGLMKLKDFAVVALKLALYLGLIFIALDIIVGTNINVVERVIKQLVAVGLTKDKISTVLLVAGGIYAFKWIEKK